MSVLTSIIKTTAKSTGKGALRLGKSGGRKILKNKKAFAGLVAGTTVLGVASRKSKREGTSLGEAVGGVLGGVAKSAGQAAGGTLKGGISGASQGLFGDFSISPGMKLSAAGLLCSSCSMIVLMALI